MNNSISNFHLDFLLLLIAFGMYCPPSIMLCSPQHYRLQQIFPNQRKVHQHSFHLNYPVKGIIKRLPTPVQRTAAPLLFPFSSTHYPLSPTPSPTDTYPLPSTLPPKSTFICRHNRHETARLATPTSLVLPPLASVVSSAGAPVEMAARRLPRPLLRQLLPWLLSPLQEASVARRANFRSSSSSSSLYHRRRSAPPAMEPNGQPTSLPFPPPPSPLRHHFCPKRLATTAPSPLHSHRRLSPHQHLPLLLDTFSHLWKRQWRN